MTYNLQEHAWLQSLYTDHMYWASVFLKDCFWAEMSTTQHSESMNAFFDGYVHARTNLKQFVDQFDNALRKKIENENRADFQSFNATIPVVSTNPHEKVFQELYTNSKFREVQQEVMGMVNCLLVLYKKEGVIATYHVEDKVLIETFIKDVTHSAYFNEAECEAKCTCGLFEMRGILCRHVFVVFRFNHIRSLPEKYILDRWIKDIKRRYVVIQSSYDGVVARLKVSKYSRIIKICYDVTTNAASCDEHMEDMIEKLHAMNLVYSSNKPPSDCLVAIPTVDMTIAGSPKKVLSPLVVRGKGRSPSLRRAGRMERLYKPTLKIAIQKEKA
ncbi:hypothetical protein I3842_08G126900 [Carya illinoinensis]|uniref:Protein FAR1-RELATED SEQUENCE n=1 Tax=Carya illinoinensis TaxID=32201 RepID=A0A922EF61_CARIL|nr:hypothetical protein I3842_08G126900 [Carya illinoinensis]